MVVQLGYAAVTSRVLAPEAFGAYAVALAGIGILGMISGSSLGQAAARRGHDSGSADGALLSLALATGTTTAALAIVLAPLWGQLWGAPASTDVTRVLALSLPTGALVGVLSGVLRRFGRTHNVAVRTAIGQLAGMGVGLATVVTVREPWSLGVAAAAAGLLTVLLLAAVMPRDHVRLRRPDAHSIEDVTYGLKSAGMNLLRSSSGQLARWSVSRFAGAASLGAFNRATTLITIPLETMQRSFNFALFPELRPGGPVFANPRTFTDMLILVAWPALILTPISYFAAPPFLAILLGPGWQAAASIAGLAALLGMVPMMTVPLASALEALGHFRPVALAWLLGSLTALVGMYGTFRTETVEPAMVGMIASEVVLLLVAGIALHRKGLIEGSRLLRGVGPLLACQAALTIGLAFCVSRAGLLSVRSLGIVIIVLCAEIGVIWSLRSRTAFGAIAKERGLPGFPA